MEKERKRVLYAIAKSGFRDAEYFIPKKILEEAGFEVLTISDEKGEAIGADGRLAGVDYAFKEVKADRYDALLIAGGPGVRKYFDNQDLLKLISDFNSGGKIVGAICAAPVALAKLGVLYDRRATVWDNPDYKNELESLGVKIENSPIVIDKNIITADGPESAVKFGEAVLKALLGSAAS